MTLNLRPYQRSGIDEVYSLLRNGKKKIIFWLATGGGKTTCFTQIVKDLIEHNMKCAVIMRRRELIKQTSGIFLKQNIPHGVYMANHYLYSPEKNIQVCSIDTLSARTTYPMADVVIIDECHDIRKSSEKYSKIIDNYKDKIIIGFTATPFADNTWAESIVCPIDNISLRDQGFLVPCKTFVPSVIDCSQVKIEATGDYNQQQLASAVNRPHITGNVIDSYKKLASGKRCILFAVNIEHSKSICQCFNENGIKAEHADAETPSGERDSILARFRSGETKILCNVNIFSTGLDVTEIEAISFVRPTKSVIYFLQAIGRGLRPSENIGKKDVIIIDHAGNTIDFGDAYHPREASLESKKEKAPGSSIPIKTCTQCFYVYDGESCPNCGFVNPKQERKITQGDGELIEFKLTPEEQEKLRLKLFISDYYKLKKVNERNKICHNWHFIKLKEKYGIDFIKKHGHHVDYQ